MMTVFIEEKKDSIGHTFLECHFTRRFTKICLSWFNDNNNANVTPNKEEFLFGISNNSMPLLNTEIQLHNIIYQAIYIYTRKLNKEALLLYDFITRKCKSIFNVSRKMICSFFHLHKPELIILSTSCRNNATFYVFFCYLIYF